MKQNQIPSHQPRNPARLGLPELARLWKAFWERLHRKK